MNLPKAVQLEHVLFVSLFPSIEVHDDMGLFFIPLLFENMNCLAAAAACLLVVQCKARERKRRRAAALGLATH
jgi:hypothetical protein